MENVMRSFDYYFIILHFISLLLKTNFMRLEYSIGKL